VNRPVAAYAHVPFCASRCPYCDYGVTVGGLDLAQALVETIAAETADALRGAPQLALSTAYIGGGSPSLLPERSLERLAGVLRERCVPEAELTVEVNPEHLDAALLAVYRSVGVTRLSVGVQALQDHLLHRCGRRADGHAVSLALRALQHWTGASNIDVLAGIQGQSSLDLRDTIAAASDAADHITLLQLDGQLAGTPAADTAGERAGGEHAADLWLEGRGQLLAAGFEHYETVHFGRGGQRSQYVLHNARLDPIVAVGPYAAGIVPAALLGERVATAPLSPPRPARRPPAQPPPQPPARPPAQQPSLQQHPPTGLAYRTWHTESAVAYAAASAATGFAALAEPITAADLLADCLASGLRLASGIERQLWHRRFGGAAALWLDAQAAAWAEAGLAAASASHWHLTAAGALVADRLTAAACADLEDLATGTQHPLDWP
jgi:coproporphyrinogen III oxidase-like Fe-S oxidoreductase